MYRGMVPSLSSRYVLIDQRRKLRNQDKFVGFCHGSKGDGIKTIKIYGKKRQSGYVGNAR